MARGIPNPLHWKFPQRLRRARKAAGLSCAALSRLAGIGTYTVAAIEAGHRIPRLPAVEKLGDALRLSPAFLAYGLDVPWEPRSGAALRCADLAARAQQVRRERGLSMGAVGRLLATSAATIQAIERGGMPALDTLEQIAVALDVSPAWLAFGQGHLLVPDGRRRPRAARPPEEQPGHEAD